MRDLADILRQTRNDNTLDDDAIVALSDPAVLEQVERLDGMMRAFKLRLGQQFLERLRARLIQAAERDPEHWQFMESARVETTLGLRPTGQLGRFSEDFGLVFAFATSPGLPFAEPWVGIATNPRAHDRIKTDIFERTETTFADAKRADPSAWWVQWARVPNWPDVSRPRNLAGLVGSQRDQLVDQVAGWITGLAPVVGDILRHEAGDGW
jgi:hypothetical protein